MSLIFTYVLRVPEALSTGAQCKTIICERTKSAVSGNAVLPTWDRLPKQEILSTERAFGRQWIMTPAGARGLNRTDANWETQLARSRRVGHAVDNYRAEKHPQGERKSSTSPNITHHA